MSDAERYARLFRGFTGRFGRYDLAGQKNAKGKEQGKARTVDEEITFEAYQKHIAGEIGIGVIPLQGEPKKPGRVNFAAIDIDVYDPEEKKAKNLTHEDVALTLSDTPLIVTRSKSGGIHAWLFSEKGVSARLAIDYLNSQAARLGVGGCEVFPKQTERSSDEDVGNWINLPYFGDSRAAVIPEKVGSTYEFPPISLEAFLDVGESMAEVVTDEWLIENTNPGEYHQRGEVIETPVFKDGPPCLQGLCIGFHEKRATIQKKFDRGEITEDQYQKQMRYTEPQLREGARDITFFNVALYLRRRISEQDPDASVSEGDLRADLAEAQGIWGRAVYGDEWDTRKHGLSRGDIERLAKQAAKGKWGYACTKEPMKGLCNRRLCLKRKFGIGTTQNDPALIDGFTIVTSSDRQYYMTVHDVRCHIPDAATLFNQGSFAQAILNQTDRMWPTMQDQKYKEMMDGLLLKADKIDPPADSDRESMLLNALHDFISSKAIQKGKNDAAIHTGRVIISDDQLEAIFKFDQFMTFLRARGFSWTPAIVSKMLTHDFGVESRPNTHLGGKQIRPYAVSLKHLEAQMGDHGED